MRSSCLLSAFALLLAVACSGSGETSADSSESEFEPRERPSRDEDSLEDEESAQEDGQDASTGGSSGSGGTTAVDGDAACTALTAETYENNEGNNAEFTAKFYPTEDRNNEYIDMFFRSDALGTHTYGEGDNFDLYTCDQCMLVVRNGKNFYPTGGTITVEEGSVPTGKKLVASLSQLTLVEIEISDSYHSIVVDGGECITLAPTTIDVQ